MDKHSLIKYEPSFEAETTFRLYHKHKDCASQSINSPNVDQIIDAILPPRDWTENDKFYIQYVSHEPASREDAIQLGKRLDETLNSRKARKAGICPIRQQIFSEAFDEAIRQVAIDCPERGLLLMRIRDTNKMTVAAYQTIYQSSIAYGVCKQVQSEEGIASLQDEYIKLRENLQKCQVKKEILLAEKELIQKEIREKNQQRRLKKQEEIRILQTQEDNFRKFFDSIRSESRKS